jgi:hypothetical protein
VKSGIEGVSYLPGVKHRPLSTDRLVLCLRGWSIKNRRLLPAFRRHEMLWVFTLAGRPLLLRQAFIYTRVLLTLFLPGYKLQTT